MRRIFKRIWEWVGHVSNLAWLWSLGGASVIAFLTSVFADLDWWQLVLLGIGTFLLILASVGTWIRPAWERNRLSDTSHRKHFANETVKIADLIDLDEDTIPVLDGYVFENCVLVGPAMLFPLPGPPNVEITGPITFSVPLESAVVAVDVSNRIVAGVFGIRGVKFIRCQFLATAFAADTSRARDLKIAITRMLTSGERTELRHGEPLQSPESELDSETPSPSGSLVPRGDLGLRRIPGPKSKNVPLIQFRTAGRTDYHIETDRKVQALRFITPIEKVVRAAELPTAIDDVLVVKVFTNAPGVLIDEKSSDVEVRTEVYYEAVNS